MRGNCAIFPVDRGLESRAMRGRGIQRSVRRPGFAAAGDAAGTGQIIGREEIGMILPFGSL
jgi:hypothetical protein